MTILHTLHWVQFAGTEKVCVDLCNEFSKEHEVYLLSSSKIKPYINDNVNLIEVDFEKNRYNPFFLYKIAQIIKKINPDIIHVHNTKELEVMYNARIFLNKNVPVIMKIALMRKSPGSSSMPIRLMKTASITLPPIINPIRASSVRAQAIQIRGHSLLDTFRRRLSFSGTFIFVVKSGYYNINK
jgi:hypothetical protein